MKWVKKSNDNTKEKIEVGDAPFVGTDPSFSD